MAVLLPGNSKETKDCPECGVADGMKIYDYVVGDNEEGEFWVREECGYQEERELPDSWYDY